MKATFTTMDDYIAGFSKDYQKLLLQMRTTIRKVAPEAEELISYQMPAYKLNGMLVYFSANKNHIGFYPTASGIKAFKNELSAFKSSKGAVQFPLDKPLPLKLISGIVKFRMKENVEKAETKKNLLSKK